MGWIKRNLFFVIGVALAVALLAASVLYIVSSSARNQKAFDQLNEIYNTLRDAATHKPSPGSDKVNNIEAAKKQAEELRQWIGKTRDYFQPIDSIPGRDGRLSDDTFAGALHRTISQLQHEADAANVTLQPQYNFSFQAQSDKVRFAPGSLEKLSVQLGEVKAISEIFFGAHVNAFDGIQRLRVSDDDTAGPATDYLDDQPVATELATLTPYEVTFRGFTAEITQVLAAFASSPHEFIIKTINVQPSNLIVGSGLQNGAPPPPMPAVTGHGLQTVLDEQMLRVTLIVEVVELSPGK